MDVLVKMSVSGAVLIAVIVIVRALAVNRLPKKAVVAAAAILAVLFAGTYIVRMVWLFPRTPPMTVNENAPLNRLLRLFRWLT